MTDGRQDTVVATRRGLHHRCPGEETVIPDNRYDLAGSFGGTRLDVFKGPHEIGRRKHLHEGSASLHEGVCRLHV